jgi:hypothetical protein
VRRFIKRHLAVTSKGICRKRRGSESRALPDEPVLGPMTFEEMGWARQRTSETASDDADRVPADTLVLPSEKACIAAELFLPCVLANTNYPPCPLKKDER